MIDIDKGIGDKGGEESKDRIRVAPRWFDYVNLAIAFLAPSLILAPIMGLLILADVAIAPGNVDEGYLQSVIPSPQLFIFGIFTYSAVVVTVALFRSESVSALQSLGRLRKATTKEIDKATSRSDKQAEQIENQVDNISASVTELKEGKE